jgi:hypothetical protein
MDDSASRKDRGTKGRRRALGAALALLLAACGGERQAESGATGSASAPGAADTAMAPAPADTRAATADPAPATQPARDTAAKPTSAAPAPGAGDTSATVAQTPARPAPAKPKPAPAAPAPSAAKTDTQPKQTAQQPSETSGATTGGDAPLRDAYHQAPRDTVSQAVYDGWKQYNLNCARCHGEDVLGTTIAPHLLVSLKPDGPINTKEAFTQVVCAGRPEKGMPSWCALGLEMDKINDIYSYVKGRSAAEIGPGRPAVKQGG